MLNAVKLLLDKDFNFLRNSRSLLAISGGVDSVVLAHLCHKLKLNFALAHCNFNLRGKESDNDEVFIEQLAEDLNVELFVQHFNTEVYAKENKLSIQMAARQLRYDWFNELSDQLGFDYILTAHHADDNLETLLINLLRGTGLEGLLGIPETNGSIVRPLLSFSRMDIEAYAMQNNVQWREDSSNADDKYLRNKLRHDVVPILKGLNPELLQSVKNTQQYLGDSHRIVEDRIAQIQRKLVTVEDDILKLNIKKLKKLSNPKAYLYYLLKDFGFTEWNDVTALLEAQSGKQVFSNSHRIIKDRDSLLLTTLEEVEPFHKEVNEQTRKVSTPQGFLHFYYRKTLHKQTNNLVFLDKDQLQFPLTIRNWKEGDVFYPFGMKGKKKLSKFFKDEKYSLLDKEKQLLLCSGNAIVWVIGKRLDNRFRVTDKAERILEIELR